MCIFQTPGYRHRECRFSLTDRLMCCVGGGLSGTVKLPRCAFVPGEQMDVHADVTNYSTKRVKRVEAFIQQVREPHSFCRVIIPVAFE